MANKPNRLTDAPPLTLMVPTNKWSSVAMDWITGWPVYNGYDAILVATDRFSKMAYFVACHKTDDAVATANIFFDAVVKNHGLPSERCSDRQVYF